MGGSSPVQQVRKVIKQANPVTQVKLALDPVQQIKDKITEAKGPVVDANNIIVKPAAKLIKDSTDASGRLNASGEEPSFSPSRIIPTASAAVSGIASTVTSAAPADAKSQDDVEKKIRGRAATLLTGASGLIDVPYTARKKLLGA